MSACNTSTVSYWPRGILEAVKESAKHGCDVWLEWFFINFSSNFGAKLRNTMTSSFSYSMIISSRLRNVKLTDFLSILANDLPPLLSMYKPPGLIGVNLDSLSHIVSIHAHPWHEGRIILLSHGVVLLGNIVERSHCL